MALYLCRFLYQMSKCIRLINMTCGRFYEPNENASRQKGYPVPLLETPDAKEQTPIGLLFLCSYSRMWARVVPREAAKPRERYISSSHGAQVTERDEIPFSRQ